MIHGNVIAEEKKKIENIPEGFLQAVAKYLVFKLFSTETMADDFSEPKRRGCIVVIAMDGSLHSQHALECKSLLSVLKILTTLRALFTIDRPIFIFLRTEPAFLDLIF